jgi:hypothetical protein
MTKIQVFCPRCGYLLADGERVADRPIYYADGSLKCIELTHVSCGVADAAINDLRSFMRRQLESA